MDKIRPASDRTEPLYRGSRKILGIPISREDLSSSEARRRVLAEEKVTFQGTDQSVPLAVESLQDFTETQALTGEYTHSFVDNSEMIQRLVELRHLGASFTARLGRSEEMVGAYGALNILTGELALSGLKVAFPQGGPVVALAQNEALGVLLRTFTPPVASALVEQAPDNLKDLHSYAYAEALKRNPEANSAQELAQSLPWSVFEVNQHLRSKEVQAQFLDSFFQSHLEKSERGRTVQDFLRETPAGLRELASDHRLYQTSLEASLDNEAYIERVTPPGQGGYEGKKLRSQLFARLPTPRMAHIDGLTARLPDTADAKKARLLLVEFAEEHPEFKDTQSLAHGLSDFSRYQWKMSGGRLSNPVLESVLKAGLEELSSTSPRAALVHSLMAHQSKNSNALTQRQQFEVYQLGLKEGAADQEFISDLLQAAEPLGITNLASRMSRELKPELYAEVRDFTSSLPLSTLQSTRERLLTEGLKNSSPEAPESLSRSFLQSLSPLEASRQIGLFRLLERHRDPASIFTRALLEVAQEVVSLGGESQEALTTAGELLKLSWNPELNLENFSDLLEGSELREHRSYLEKRVADWSDVDSISLSELAPRLLDLKRPDGESALSTPRLRESLMESQAELNESRAEQYLKFVALAAPVEKPVLARNLGRLWFPDSWEQVNVVVDRLEEPGRSVWQSELLEVALNSAVGHSQPLLVAVKERLLKQGEDLECPADLGILVLENEPPANTTAAAVLGYGFDEFGMRDHDQALGRQLLKSGLEAVSPSVLLDRALHLVPPEERQNFLQRVAVVLLSDPKYGIDERVFSQVSKGELGESDLLWLIRTSDEAFRSKNKLPEEVKVDEDHIVIGGEQLEVDL